MLALPAMQEALAAQGAQAMPTTPEQFAATIKQDYQKWKPVIEGAKVKLD